VQGDLSDFDAVTNALKGVTGASFADLGAHETGDMTGFQIQKRVDLSDDKVVLEIQSGGAGAPMQMVLMKRIGDEWKLSDLLKN
jgi:hypothetical protein